MPAPVSFYVSTLKQTYDAGELTRILVRTGQTQLDVPFFATPVAWDYSKGEERQFHRFGRKRKTYAESKVHSATKRGTRQKVRRILDRRRSSGYAPGIRCDANHWRWNLGRACRSG